MELDANSILEVSDKTQEGKKSGKMSRIFLKILFNKARHKVQEIKVLYFLVPLKTKLPYIV